MTSIVLHILGTLESSLEIDKRRKAFYRMKYFRDVKYYIWKSGFWSQVFFKRIKFCGNRLMNGSVSSKSVNSYWTVVFVRYLLHVTWSLRNGKIYLILLLSHVQKIMPTNVYW